MHDAIMEPSANKGDLEGFRNRLSDEEKAMHDKLARQEETEKRMLYEKFDLRIRGIQGMKGLSDEDSERRTRQAYLELTSEENSIKTRYAKMFNDISKRNSDVLHQTASNSSMRVVPVGSSANVRNYENLADGDAPAFIPDSRPLKARAGILGKPAGGRKITRTTDTGK